MTDAVTRGGGLRMEQIAGIAVLGFAMVSILAGVMGK